MTSFHADKGIRANQTVIGDKRTMHLLERNPQVLRESQESRSPNTCKLLIAAGVTALMGCGSGEGSHLASGVPLITAAEISVASTVGFSSAGVVANDAAPNSGVGTGFDASDLLAALKMAHGRSPNADPDGPGPAVRPPISAAQRNRFDANGDGLHTVCDAKLISRSIIGGSAGDCGMFVNRPPKLEPIPNIVVVAGRAIPSLQVTASDVDSGALVYFTPEFPEDQQKGLAALNIPARSLLEFIGLKIAPVTGRISGTPKAPGKYPITVVVSDPMLAVDYQSFNIEILPESVSVSLDTPQVGAPVLRVVASDTSRGGSVAYCIKPSTEIPKASDTCFKTDAAGGRTVLIPIPAAGEKLAPVYLFTKDAGGNVLTAGVPSFGVKPLVLMETSQGPFVLELEPDKTKITTDNFLKYVEDGYYDGTVFHRIISPFVLQGGGFIYTAGDNPPYSVKGGLRDPIPLERPKDSGLSNTKGTIAMARTNQPDSATSQFFINVVDNSASLDTFDSYDPAQLRPGYAVFGRVIPPTGGLTNDLPPALTALRETPVSGQVSGAGTVTITYGENSAPVGNPPLVIRTRRIN